MLSPISGRYLSFVEREEIGLLSCQGVAIREIARRIGRCPSTVSRELTRNAATRAGRLEYRASVAQWKAELVAKRPKASKLTTNPRLRQYVQERLEGKVRDAKGRHVSGPVQAPSIGRNKPHRSDRKWVNGWSPIKFPTDCRLTSRMTNPCAFLTKPFTRLSTFRAEGLSSVNWLAVYAADGRCACPEPGHKRRPGHTLARR